MLLIFQEILYPPIPISLTHDNIEQLGLAFKIYLFCNEA